MGGWSELHELLWPQWDKPLPFQIGWEFAQFEHHLKDPRGLGFDGKVWTLWPSTNVDEFWPAFSTRIEAEGLPAVEAMLDRQALIDSISNELERGIYIRAKELHRTPEIIHQLQDGAK